MDTYLIIIENSVIFSNLNLKIDIYTWMAKNGEMAKIVNKKAKFAIKKFAIFRHFSPFKYKYQ